MFKVPEQYRIKTGPMASEKSVGLCGAFMLKSPIDGAELGVIASNELGWEHVSVSRRNRCPNWVEMCFIKDLFWDSEDCVIQYHPPKSQYVNNCQNCLHMWRKIGFEFPIPKSILVGLKEAK